MFVLAIYDVNTEDASGQKRLRKVAKICERYGSRVQNSSFECDIDPSSYEMFKHELLEVIDRDSDSIRFYLLGKRHKDHIEHFGVSRDFAQQDVLLI